MYRACARVGKKVIHFDRNDFYGNQYSSFSLETFHRYLSSQSNLSNEGVKNVTTGNSLSIPTEPLTLISNYELVVPSSTTTTTSTTTSTTTPTNSDINTESNVEPTTQPNETSEGKQETNTNDFASLLIDSRRYNIDLISKIQFANSEEIRILISSAVARYLEFKTIDKTYLFLEKQFQSVPCTKSDLFRTTFLGLVEKRLLNKFITFVRAQLAKNNNQQLDDDDEPNVTVSKEEISNNNNNDFDPNLPFVDLLKVCVGSVFWFFCFFVLTCFLFLCRLMV